MHHEILDESVLLEEQDDPQPLKRNSGRSGPTSSEGRARSSQNAIKHGACAQTLILPAVESEDAWLLLLKRWCDTYQPEEDSLEYDFVLKTAQAEWHRIRNQRNYNNFLSSTDGLSPFNWTAEQIKMHDLLLRYKTAAERAFQREYRTLEQHLKIHRPSPGEFVPDPPTTLVFTTPDATSPTGYRVVHECFGPPKPDQPKPALPLATPSPGEPTVHSQLLAPNS